MNREANLRTLERPTSPSEARQEAAGRPIQNPAFVPDAVDQAYKEFCRRRADGESLDAEGYCSQFPQFKSSLCRLLQAELFLEQTFADEPEVRWPEVGETFLDYRLILELGSGAFARVFLATEPKLGDRLVAVKISRHGGSEAEVLGRNPHPNIVPVYSVKEDRDTGLTSVCMPYLGSATLANVLDHANLVNKSEARAQIILDIAAKVKYPLDPTAQRLAPDRILHCGSYVDGVRLIGAKLAEALTYLHERGICHRDLKLSNVLLSPEGEPMLLDFNLCADDQETLVRLGGTMPYMSPEQLRATGAKLPVDEPTLDARADIFSLGVILYELATGEHPFGALTLKLSAAKLREHLLQAQERGPIPADQVNPNVDSTFARLIQRCLAWEPAARPQSAAEIATRLRSDLASVGRTKRWLTRNPGIVLAASLVFLALGLGAYATVAMRAPYHERETENGVRLYQAGRYDEAVEAFSDALSANPGNAAALFARGRAFQRLGKYNQALKDFADADAKGPDARNQVAMGYCLNQMNHNDQAAASYRLALEAGHESAEIHNNLAHSLVTANRDKADAKKCLDRAIQLNPRLQAAFHNRALLALRSVQTTIMQEGPKARDGEEFRTLAAGISDINKAIEIGPGSAKLFSDAAYLSALAAHVDARSVVPAIAHLQEAVKHGCNPELFKDPVFEPLRSEESFKKMKSQVANLQHSPQPNLRIVDPIRDDR